MNKYSIAIKIHAVTYIEVEAESERAARLKAEDDIWENRVVLLNEDFEIQDHMIIDCTLEEPA